MAPADRSDPNSYKVGRAKLGGDRDYVSADQVRQLHARVRTRLAPEPGYGDAPKEEDALAG